MGTAFGLHFDWTITLGNCLTMVFFAFATIKFWSAQVESRKDIEWRIANLEVWRREHMIDSDARDELLKKLDRVCDHLEWLVKDRERENRGKRHPRDGQV